jgi:trehalose 6-phosphate phosphatase
MLSWGELSDRIGSAGTIAVGINFDGTLVPIQERADEVTLPPSTRTVLQKLAAVRGVTVAVLSGRSLADLDARLSVPGLLIVANHGFERRLPGGLFRLSYGHTDLDAVRQVILQVATVTKDIPGVWMEDKGGTAALHYRQAAPEAQSRVRATLSQIASRLPAGVRVDEGKRVYAIRPDVPDGTQGRFLQEAFAEAGVPDDAMRWYFGDDVMDEEVFAGLPAEAISVHVGSLSDRSAARYLLESPAEVVFTLDALRQIAEKRPATGI